MGRLLSVKRGPGRFKLAARTLRAARALSAAQAANNRTMDHHTSVMRDPRERSAHRKAEAERKPASDCVQAASAVPVVKAI